MNTRSRRPTVTIEDVEADENVLTSSIDCSPELRQFFSGEEFRAEYSIDVGDVPEHVLAIPVLAHVAPVAWTRNADVRVEVIDTDFLAGLQRVRDALQRMYPGLIRGGTHSYRELVDADSVADGDGSGLLFTAGVDSMSSYLHHRDEDPTLVSVNGWTVFNDEEEKWARAKSHYEAFGDDHGVDNVFVESNMLTFVQRGILSAHAAPHVEAANGSWYISVGHGLGLLGLCAPVAHALGIGDLYMAATHWEGVDLDWGSHPDIDGNVQWAGTQCHHDGYELTRQERIRYIADHVREEEPDLELRSCNLLSHNCGECETCLRTAVGLLLEGLDPNDHGFPFDETSFDEIRARFEGADWLLGPHERITWEDVQNHVSPDETYPMDADWGFFEWLNRADFAEFVERSNLDSRTRLRHTVYRNTPYPAFNAFYRTPVYSYLRG